MTEKQRLIKQWNALSNLETRLEHDLAEVRELLEDIDLKLSEYGDQEEDDVIL